MRYLLCFICIFYLNLSFALSCSAQAKVSVTPGSKRVISVWHWGSQTEPYGINRVIVDSAKVAKVLASYKRNGVTRVYGGYLRMPSTPDKKEAVKRWCRKLHSAGIQPVYLIGSPKWVYPEYRKDMVGYIIENYIKYNRSVDISEQLCGIHLDIEPHGLQEWSKASLERKREIMSLLKDTYKVARDLLIENGLEKDEIMADIPFWYDTPEAVGWRSDSDRKQWFSDIANYIDGISIMNYQNSSVATLIARAQWEQENFNGVVEIGLDSEDVGKVWKSKDEFRNAVGEILKRTQAPIAIHRYIYVLKLQGY